MRKVYLVSLIVCVILSWMTKVVNGATLSSWDDIRAYHPIPVVCVHGMNSSPVAWGFQIDPVTGNVTGYTGTSAELRNYFDDYLKQNPDTGAYLSYLEPFNYQFNTFDSVSWNAWEGYDNSGEQYSDSRIRPGEERPTLRWYLHKERTLEDSIGGVLSKYLTDKIQLVAHSLGGIVSRYYMDNRNSRGANVLQLTTLGSPHFGTVMATIARNIFGNPVTDIHNMGRWKRWIVIITNKAQLLKDIPVDRYPTMIDEVRRYSEFISDLNDPANMPKDVRHYCIADTLVPVLCKPMGDLPIPMTDGFLELNSTLSVPLSEQLPCTLEELAKYKPKGYLPKYKGRLLTGKKNWHMMLPGRDDEILKAIDDVKPVIEITEIRDYEDRIIWQTGMEYMDVIIDRRLRVHGLCRKEYLPANAYVNAGFRKAGETEITWFTLTGGSTENQDDAGRWLLQPSDLWHANDLNSPVAEFEVEISFPYQAVTHSIVVQATNPAGIKSDPVEVNEKSWYMYAVGKGDNGEARFWCIDGPTSFADGVAAVVSEFSLIDEEGNKIYAKPLDITTDGGTIWVSFDNRRIYSYTMTTMKPNRLPDGRYYYNTAGIPDGLYYDGNLQYCSSMDNKIYGIELFNGTETDFGSVSRKLSINGGEVPYIVQEYASYNPSGISHNFLTSSELKKISKRKTSWDSQPKLIQTLPESDYRIWTNEQDTPASCLGIVEITDNSVPEGYVTYLSCTDGNIYKIRFVSKTIINRASSLWGVSYHKNLAGGYSYHYDWGSYYSVEESIGGDWEDYKLHRVSRIYGKVVPPSQFIQAVAVHQPKYTRYKILWNGSNWVTQTSSNFPLPITYSICSYDEDWNTNLSQYAEEIYNNATLGAVLWTAPYWGITNNLTETSPKIRVTDVTEKISAAPFYYTGRYGNEGQVLSVIKGPIPSPIPVGFVTEEYLGNLPASDQWFFLTRDGLSETLGQFSVPFTKAEGIATGPRVKTRVEPEELLLQVGQSGQIKVNGKGPYVWSSSDETVCVVKEVIGSVWVEAVGTGESTITVRDDLGNIGYARVRVGQW